MGHSQSGLILENKGMHVVQPKKGKKVQWKGTIVDFYPSFFLV